LSAAIKTARTELQNTRDSLRTTLGQGLTSTNGAFINTELETAQMTWDEFKSAQGLTDDTYKEAFESWKTAYWDAKTALDGWDEAAIIAADKISKSMKAAEANVDTLTKSYQKLKTVADMLNATIQEGTNLTMAQRA